MYKVTMHAFSTMFVVTCLCMGGLRLVPLHTGAPMVKTQAGFYRLMVGDIEVTALSDGTIRCRRCNCCG